MIKQMHFILFIVGYYIVWFGSLLLAQNHFAYYPLFLSILVSSCQTIYLKYQDNTPKLIHFIIIFTLTGFTIDTVLALSNIIVFEPNPWSPYLAAPWVLGLWLNFSVLCLGIRSFLKKVSSYLWCMALIGFPFAYYAGSQFDVAIFTHQLYSLTLLGVIWMIVFPLIARLYLLKNI